MDKIISFNLMDIVNVVWNWRKKIILAVILVTGITAAIVFIIPREYLAEATVVAANPNLGDRSNIFNTTFEQQFSYYGAGSDNDRLFEMSRIDTMKMFLIDSFKLEDHYKISRTNSRRRLAAYNELKEKSDFYVTELGHLRIKIWDTDRKLAANMANTVVNKINQRSIEMTNAAKQQIIKKLQQQQESNEAEVKQLIENPAPGVPAEINTARKTSLLKQIEENNTLINQFKVSLNNVSNLYVIQYATPALKIDRPKRLPIIVMAFLLSLFFSVLAALLLNRLRTDK
ncbi:MAG: hypothetical protein HYR66_07220 [Sphingobacteriales bacterium]|nr:hypothetical protein [Sphingobacteriales bacterium]MBI3718167.1 hypothetical protein [Sphingobacteriales bacterium]